MAISRFGGAESLELMDQPEPSHGPDEVLVAVRACALNPVDYKLRRAGALLGFEAPLVTGYDVSGEVVEAGELVTDLRPGDEVFYAADPRGSGGALAELHTARAATVARKPAGLSHEEAAALPVGGCTAWEALIDRAGLRPGEVVLVHGAGGVGALALQIACAAGAHVLVSCGRAMLERVVELGAARAVSYADGDFTEMVREETGARGVDVVLDTAGGDLIARSVTATAPHGRCVAIADAKGDLSAAFERNLTLHFVALEPQRRRLEAIRSLVERGLLRPLVEQVVALEQVADGQALLERGGLTGKVVVRVG